MGAYSLVRIPATSVVRLTASDIGIDTADLLREKPQRLEEGRSARNVYAEEILDLAAGDQHGGAGGETDHHGMRNEIDQRPHARQPQCQLEQSGEEGQGQHQADELRRARRGVRADRGEHGDGNGRGGTGDQMPGRTEQRGDDGRRHRRIKAILRRQAGNGGEGHRLGQHDQRPG